MKSFKKTQRSLMLAAAIGMTCAAPSAMALELPSLSGLLESLLGPTGLLGTNTLAGANVLGGFVDIGATPSLIGADVIGPEKKQGTLVDANVVTDLLDPNKTATTSGTSVVGADVLATGASGTLIDANVLSKNATTTVASTPVIGADVLSTNTGTTGSLVDVNVLAKSDKLPAVKPAIAVNVLSHNQGEGEILTISLLSKNDTSAGTTPITPSATLCDPHGWNKRCH